MFSEEFLLLQQEGYLFRSCLTQGLTGLRNANLHDVGEYYTAFFQLSIGLERLMKVIVIIDHAARSDLAFQKNKMLRAIRHDLGGLLVRIRGIGGPWTNNPLDFVSTGSTEAMIVDQINEFAKGARYFNLDTLTGSLTSIDPLQRWKMILEHISNTDVPTDKRQQVTHYGARIERALRDRNLPST